MVVSYSAKGDSFGAMKPSPWGGAYVMNNGPGATWDLAPDGKRIIAVTTGADDEKQIPPTHLTFLFNFFDDLQRRK